MGTGFDRTITAEIVIPAQLHEVWQAWTSEAGVLSFFAPACLAAFADALALDNEC